VDALKEAREQEQDVRDFIVRFFFVGGVVVLVAGLSFSLPGMVVGSGTAAGSDGKPARKSAGGGERGRDGEG
jgi:hypothetical protein